MEEKNLKILNQIHKATKMGMDSISFVSEKIDDNELKDNLSFQYTQYGQVMDRVNKLYENYGEIPEDKNIMDKVMGWTGVQMNTQKKKPVLH